MASRRIGELAAPEIRDSIGPGAILCLPMGSIEQHGPHLPLDTDLVIADAMTAAIVARWGDDLDLWQLPAIPFGLSREHAWAPGTMSLTVAAMNALLRDLAAEIARSLPARNLAIVNGHGGNRGLLEASMREMRSEFGLNVCALHLGALMADPAGRGVPDIHGGREETSAMLALAPDRVRRERMSELTRPPQADTVRSTVLDPAISWPWSSNDPGLSDAGVIGDVSGASAELGRQIVERAVAAAGPALKALRARGA